MTDPDVVGSSEAQNPKRTRAGQILCDFFPRVFELPSPRNAQKRDKTNRESRKKNGFGFFSSSFLQKLFDTICLQNVFCSVFEIPSLRNTRERDKTKKSRKNWGGSPPGSAGVRERSTVRSGLCAGYY
jgi:hypothetical protein